MTMTLTDELNFRMQAVEAHMQAGNKDAAVREEDEVIAITACLDTHPDEYEGPCACGDCRSYGAEDCES